LDLRFLPFSQKVLPSTPFQGNSARINLLTRWAFGGKIGVASGRKSDTLLTGGANNLYPFQISHRDCSFVLCHVWMLLGTIYRFEHAAWKLDTRDLLSVDINSK
jgi:hypothetical protein